MSKKQERRGRVPVALLALALLVLALPLQAAPPEQPVGGIASAIRRTGMKLPRWASLRSDAVNLRSGPGTRYPIQWVYKRKGLPVEIVAEFDTWRRIRDFAGTEGWVHQSNLSGRRHFLVRGGAKTQPMFRKRATDASIRAEVEAGAQGRLLSCRDDWCKVELGAYRGFMKNDTIWGVYSGEKVE